MNQAVDLVVAREPPDPLLEQPDPPHRGEQADGLLATRAASEAFRPYAVTAAVPTTCRTAAATFSSLGITHASSGSL